jgi:hypothetical protein
MNPESKVYFVGNGDTEPYNRGTTGSLPSLRLTSGNSVDSPPSVYSLAPNSLWGVSTMSNPTDKFILQKVNQRLSRLGGSQSKITASINRGEVMLSGTVQFEMQRRSIVKVATSVPGVRRVIDQVGVKPKEKRV